MIRYLVWRLIWTVPGLLGASVLVFGVLHLLPGDPVTLLLGVTAIQSDAYRDEILRSLYLDRPLAEQYLRWLGGILRGDLGRSLVSGLPVASEIARSLPATLQLVALAMLLAMALGLPAGVLAARRGGGVDLAVRVSSLVFLSAPAFVIGLVLIVGLSYYAPWVPVLGSPPGEVGLLARVAGRLVPALALAAPLAAVLLRFVRGRLLEVLAQPYIRTARAKGLPEPVVAYRHALRNALVPVLAVAGTQAVQLVGSLVVVEQVFAIPGVARLLVNAIYQRDYVMVQGVLLTLVALATAVHWALDVLYALLDPRVRHR